MRKLFLAGGRVEVKIYVFLCYVLLCFGKSETLYRHFSSEAEPIFVNL